MTEGRILLVDDDPGVLGAYSRLLGRTWDVATAEDPREAVSRLREDFDVVVSDVSMPRMNGIEFLRAVRERDADTPVVLMTGSPYLDTAIGAVEHGAFRFLVKPVAMDTLEATLRKASLTHRAARLRRQALEAHAGAAALPPDPAPLAPALDHALASLWMAFQPIVSWSGRRIVAYEALARTQETSFKHPGALLAAAAQARRSWELGRAVRRNVAAALPGAPAGVDVFLNLAASDLLDDNLYDPAAPASQVASRLVLEITERSSIDDIPDVRDRVAALRALGFRIAVDDLGAGYSSLVSLAVLQPDVVKLDMTLVRGIDCDPTRQSVVRSMVSLCRELGAGIVAEGVETPAERDSVTELGATWLQGYLFARPAKGFVEATF